ncbi:MAG: inorganic phosphate transporter [Pirellulaceae bacterium]|nr:inorganic phosphate transporter [Pirellulaceae bacterium]
MLTFETLAMLVGLAMLTWDCVEVGRNDAANLVNAVFGARVLRRRTAVLIAGVAVVLGASFSAPVMETTRKGLFDPTVLKIQMAIAIYVSVYFVDTVLLYGFSGFGMPVSTTALLVFEVVGAALFLAGPKNISWNKVGDVILAIVLSIAISLTMSFLVMRVFRGAVRDKADDRDTVLLHGPWIAGAILTWLTWFMVFKGLKNIELVNDLRESVFKVYGDWVVLLAIWGVFTLLIHLVLVSTHQRGYKYLFSVTAVLGMICMAFAFGQNDLANAASPGLSSFTLWRHGGEPTDLANLGTEIPIPPWALFICGLLMASGMLTKYAQRVTRAAVNTGSQFDHVSLYAPEWCQRFAHWCRTRGTPHEPLAPKVALSETGKKIHYDTLRASVITGVSASVIAFASGLGLPVSTTYVAFAAVLGTGMSDRVFSRGDADLKLGRAIWVVTCWFLTPVIAIVATGCVAVLVYRLSIAGLFLCLCWNLAARAFFHHRADAHERRFHKDVHPADQEGGDSVPASGEAYRTEEPRLD